MHAVKISIVAWVSDDQPGIVKCVLRDAWRNTYEFVEKLPVVTAADLWPHSEYPQPGAIACRIIRCWRDETDREMITIDTDEPWGCEATSGETTFDVLAEQLEEFDP
jgi:hypothetical protein